VTGGYCVLVNGADGIPKPPTVTGVFLFAKMMEYIITNHLTELQQVNLLCRAIHDPKLPFDQLGMIVRLLNNKSSNNFYTVIQESYNITESQIDSIMAGLSKKGYAKPVFDEDHNGYRDLWTLIPQE
jgi:hypothetical protein